MNTKSLGKGKGDAESSSKLPDVISPTVAADSLKEHTATLVRAFRHCLSSLADSLYSQSIIPEDAHRRALNKYLDEDERSRALVSCVEARLEIQPSDFRKFIDILKLEPFFGTLSDQLVQSYCTFSSMPATTTSSPAISQYAAYLKGVYRNSPISPDKKWPPTPSKKYITLAKVHYKCRDEFIGETLEGNIRELLKYRKEISIADILVHPTGVNLKLILIEGAPGIGKSTLAWELCRRWEQGCMEKYSLTVLFRLRERETQEIKSISELFYSYPGEDKEVLAKKISLSNGKGVLFILDGFDELPTNLQKEGVLVDLVRGTFLPECTVLVTSRPSATAELLTICRPLIQKHIEILGFTQKGIEEYATSIFSSEPEKLQKFKAFISASDNPAINSLMYIPLNAAIIVEIYRHSKSDHLLPHTLTEVYSQLCLTILNRYLQNNHPLVTVNEFKDLPGSLCGEFLKLSEVAFDGMGTQKVTFHTLPSDLVHFGFMDAVPSLYGGGSVSYNFLHLTLQEFFAAYYISHLTDDARLALLRECGTDERWNIVWRFVAGLTGLKFFAGHLNSDLFVAGSEENEIKMKPLFIQCLFEAAIKMDSPQNWGLKSIITFESRKPLDLYALGYCIANLVNGVAWNITSVNGLSFECLTSGLKTNATASHFSNINKLHIALATNVIPHLIKHFPLHGITDLALRNCHLSSCALTDLSKLLPSMNLLEKIDISQNDFDLQCGNNFLKKLSQTNVTSLNVQNTILTESPSALLPLIDPQTGTLRELCAGSSYSKDEELIDMVCSPSSLKSLKLVQRLNFNDASLLTQLQTNTCLTKLDLKFIYKLFPTEAIDIIIGILVHNKTLEYLSVGRFSEGEDIIRKIVGALSKNSILRSITISIGYYHFEKKYKSASDYMRAEYPELCRDSRISWISSWDW